MNQNGKRERPENESVFTSVIYGSHYLTIDVTATVMFNGGVIPSTEAERAELFGDPHVGVPKTVSITCDGENAQQRLWIRRERLVQMRHLGTFDWEMFRSAVGTLSIVGGCMTDEQPEQEFVWKYLPKSATVLEIGGDVGSVACVAASIIEGHGKMVVVEASETSRNRLAVNRSRNNLFFTL